MSKRVRVITLSCVTVLCCIAIIIAGTFALFTDDVQVTNHLQAGNLKVKLTRNSYCNLLLNNQGLLEEVTSDVDTDFTGANPSNIFGLVPSTDEVEGTKLVPGCVLEATFTLDNIGDVAFNYYLQFTLNLQDEEVANALANQLELTITVGDNEPLDTVKLSELGENNTLTTGTLAQILSKSSGQFTVKLEFVNITSDEITNNLAQGQAVYVDMYVHAVQAVD